MVTNALVQSPLVSLRRTKDSDVDFVVAAEGAEENRRFVFQQSVDEHRGMLNNENFLHMIIGSDDIPVGYAILTGLKNKNKSIELMRILITKKGQGYGREAIRLCKALVFERIKAHRLWLDVVQYNKRAHSLYLSEGFTQEGVLRESDLFEDRYESLVIMSMLEQEYCPDEHLRPPDNWPVYELGTDLRQQAVSFVSNKWGSDIVVTRGEAHSAWELAGFAVVMGGKITGLITYHIDRYECQIITLDSLVEGQGIATALMNKVLAVAQDRQCKRVWLITTNDNTPALRFYQKRDFSLVRVHFDAVARSREIKPQIPLLGVDDIPILHEVEFEKRL